MINPNSGFIYLIVSIVILFVLAQSVYFLKIAWKRAKELGIDTSALKKVISTSAVFTIIPSISIAMGVLVLANALGLPIPWLRLSVIGSLSYETTAAASAATAFGYDLSSTITSPKIFSAIVWAMSIGTLPAFIIVPIFGKRLENGMARIEKKDSRWRELFGASLFIGMIATFLGAQFSQVTTGLKGWIPIFVALVSMGIMAGCRAISKKTKASWLENYALPFSMLGAMMMAIPISGIVNLLAN